MAKIVACSNSKMDILACNEACTCAYLSNIQSLQTIIIMKSIMLH
jgi:hypothetical protein